MPTKRLPFILSFWLLLLAVSTHALATDSVGRVIIATGEAWRIQGEQTHPLNRLDFVYAGDRIETGDGTLTLRMNDTGTISLHPGSSLIIHRYQARTESATANIRLELKHGNMRSQTGNIGQASPEHYRLDTPFAALGIRGTEYTADLHDNILRVFVHEGAIRLAPFTPNDCIADTLGPCNTSAAEDLAAGEGQWLQLKAGHPIERITTEPDFISDQLQSSLQPGLLYGADGELLQPYASLQYELIQPDTELPEADLTPSRPSPDTGSIQLEGLYADLLLSPNGDTDGDGIPDLIELQQGTNPWLADTDMDGLPDHIDPEPRRGNSHLFATDDAKAPMSENELRYHLRHTSIRIDSYAPETNQRLFHLDTTLRLERKLSIWTDPQQQRIWGQTGTLHTFLSARALPEGRIWQRLPELLADAGATNTEWISQISNMQTPLWHLPLDRHSLYFTPGNGPANTTDTSLFNMAWSQPLGNADSTVSAATVSGFRAQADGRFRLMFNTGTHNYSLRGATGEAGTLFADTDNLALRGHWEGDSALLLITEKSSGQQWMFGLRSSSTSATPLLAQWQGRKHGTTSWGHWADFASLDPETVAKLVEQHGASLLHNRHFSLVPDQNNSLPTQGQANFTLTGAQAVYSGENGLRPADVINPMLRVDFNRQRFVTSFDVVAPGLNDPIAIKGSGGFDDTGLMQGDNHLSTTQLQGSLNSNGQGASLLFEKQLDANSHVSGITHWQQ